MLYFSHHPILAMLRILSLALLLLPGCAADAPPSPDGPAEAVQADSLHPSWDEFFAAAGGTGTAVVLDAESGQQHVVNPQRARERFSPASTFKVYNSLVALETGVAPDVDSMYTWDGIERGGAWDQDHSLRMGMKNSTVWLYQELARRIGLERYAAAFAREPYGNNTLGDEVTMFWLGTPLRISADEQIALLDRLRQGTLAFRPDVQAAVRDLMLLEATDTYRLYGKTGWTWSADDRSDEIGWLVGWIERGEAAWVYALNVSPQDGDFDMRSARFGIRDAILRDLGLLPPPDGS